MGSILCKMIVICLHLCSACDVTLSFWTL